MKSLAILLLLLTSQAAPRPAWEVAGKWTCEMAQLRICQGLGGKCELIPNQARFRIDFTGSRFGVDIPASIYSQSAAATPAHDFSEAIVARTWFAPKDKDPGFTKLVLDSGDGVTLAGRPRTGETREAILTRNGIDSQYHWYGTCSPDEAKP
ncbi:hypothetical protein OF829_04210 [Sphingomonas sp. LB-2]|uniref:hypothetical protein n=1 Tax=Sphingomonas caeni TaxID=2984949 RepID=UPI00222E7DE3|nr:hypothetical protein [Sphingomonas caeni]MCW3846431.1 hypothetical protein [Sphingomonas caeni]